MKIFTKQFRIISFAMILMCFVSSLSFISYAQQKSPKLNVTSVTLLQNQNCTIQVYRLTENQNVTFSIQDDSIAVIKKTTKKSCTLKALSVGKTKLITTISQKNKKNKILKCTIVVTPPAVSVRFKKETLTLLEGDGYDLRSLISIKPSITAEVPVFTSSNTDCLRVTPNGYITALSPGKATVTATISNGKSDQITVNIINNKNEDSKAAKDTKDSKED